MVRPGRRVAASWFPALAKADIVGDDIKSSVEGLPRMSDIQLNSRGWSIQQTAARRGGVRRSVAPASSLPAEFLAEEATIAAEFTAEPSAAVRRGAAPAEGLDFSCDLAEGEAAL